MLFCDFEPENGEISAIFLFIYIFFIFLLSFSAQPIQFSNIIVLAMLCKRHKLTL